MNTLFNLKITMKNLLTGQLKIISKKLDYLMLQKVTGIKFIKN